MKQLSFTGSPQLAIAVGATSPDPGILGSIIWSTTESAPLLWNGTKWIFAGSKPVFIGDTAPDPLVHPIWITTAGDEYVWDGSYWFQVNGIPDLSSKQDVLSSGVNIKTINGQSILGAGNLSVSGSGSSPILSWVI